MFAVVKSKVNASLFISALYFIIWSLLVIGFPSILKAVIVEPGNTPLIFWDFMSLITLVLGIGLMIAATNPYRHWTIILLVTLFHLAMIAGFIFGYEVGFFNMQFMRLLFMNHIIWLVPNFVVLYIVYKRNFETDDILIDTFNADEYPLSLFDTTDNESLADLNAESPLMLVFLRHFGCPFCKDSLLQLGQYRRELEAKGIKIVVVYMVEPEKALSYLDTYGLGDIAQVSDPEEILYKRFRLKRGDFFQLFGAKVWVRWVELAFKKKLFNTQPAGNVTQMPGIFLIEDGVVVKQFVHKSVADTPDYNQFLQ